MPTKVGTSYVGSALVINSLVGLLVDKERSADSSITQQRLANIYIPLRPVDADMRPGGLSCIGKSLIDKVVTLITKLEPRLALKGTAPRVEDLHRIRLLAKAVAKITTSPSALYLHVYNFYCI